MVVKKVRLKKSKNNVFYPGDLLFYKNRNCEITVVGYDTIFGGYRVIFHDIEIIGNIPEEKMKKYCYKII